jgi:hypothetical protein
MKAMNFTATTGLYAIAGNPSDMMNQAVCRIAHLEAMLIVTTGDFGMAFRRNLSEAAQDKYMKSCCMAAGEVSQLLDSAVEYGLWHKDCAKGVKKEEVQS